MLKDNKKAQVGETATWMIATLIILFVLTTFYFLAGMLAAKGRLVDINEIDILNEEDIDWIGEKTNIAFGKLDRNKGTIQKWIEKEGQQDE